LDDIQKKIEALVEDVRHFFRVAGFFPKINRNIKFLMEFSKK